MSGPPHGKLYNDHPHNVWAWEIMHGWWYEGFKHALDFSPQELAVIMRAEYGEELRRRCIDYATLTTISQDAAHPVYPSRDRAHPPPTEAPPAK